MEKMLNDYMNSCGIREALEIPKKKYVLLKLLGRGEYNINYVFTHPIINRRLVLRINTASQMGLENQIEYEYRALQFLESSRRTPRVYYVDGSKTALPFGVLVMEYLDGRSLDYHRDLEKAAAIFSDIHSLPTDKADFLIKPENLLKAMLEECTKMASVYLSSDLGENQVKRILEMLLQKSAKLIEDGQHFTTDYRIINTEVNSGNFIINEAVEECYLIDWEKPILGEVEQDMAHFMAPTTTFWKTDKILSMEEQQQFIRAYKDRAKGRVNLEGIEENLKRYLPLTCLRGITWCSMAWIHYQDGQQMIRNEDTFKKLKSYLKDDFLNMVIGRYF